MAETPGHRHVEVPDEPPEEPHQVHLNSPARTSADSLDTSAREATELARIRSNYTRASSYHHAGSSVRSSKPDGLLERFNYTIRVFWRRQISITVPHSTCRDHLGMSLQHVLLSTPHVPIPTPMKPVFPNTRHSRRAPTLCPYLLPDQELRGWWLASLLMQKVICCSYFSVSRSHLQLKDLLEPTSTSRLTSFIDGVVWEKTRDHAPCHVGPCLSAVTVAVVPGILYGIPC